MSAKASFLRDVISDLERTKEVTAKCLVDLLHGWETPV